MTDCHSTTGGRIPTNQSLGSAAPVDTGTPTPDLEARTEAAAKALCAKSVTTTRSQHLGELWPSDAGLLARDALAAAGVPALIAEVERLHKIDYEVRQALGKVTETMERLRAQRQTALDLCDEATSPLGIFRPDWVPAVRAALGVTE